MTKITKKISIALATAAIALPMSVVPNAAHANGGRITAGVLGGLVGGLILGSALAPQPAYGYGPGPVYFAAPPRCYWTHGAPVWDGYYGTWVRPRVRVCE